MVVDTRASSSSGQRSDHRLHEEREGGGKRERERERESNYDELTAISEDRHDGSRIQTKSSSISLLHEFLGCWFQDGGDSGARA